MSVFPRRLSFSTLSKIENILIFAIIWACILSIHFAYKKSGAITSIKLKTQDNINNKNVIEEKPVLNNPEFLQSDLAEMVQKELEDSKMLQKKAMFKEVIRAKEGELYSTVKIEEVYKRFDEKRKQNDKKINSDKRHPNLPKYLINGDSVCSSDKVDILFYIHSKIGNEKNRNGIRQTYGNKGNFKRLISKVVFILGRGNNKEEKKNIIKESEAHHDIVQADFTDVHTNLSLKVLTFLQWISDHCSDPVPQFIVKVDDDFFVNPFMLIEELLPDVWEKDNFVSCHAKENSPVVRNKNSKWYVPESAYPKKDPDVFIKTCSGYTAILPGDMIPVLRSLSADTPIIPVDDAYLFSVLFGKIENAEYIQILDSMTLNKEAGFQDYKGNKRLKFMSVSCWGEVIDDMNTLWKGTLKHLTTLGKQLINPKRLSIK